MDTQVTNTKKERRTPRRPKGEAYWRRHVQQWRDSGLSQSEYCRNNKLALGSFGHWKIKLVGPDDAQTEKIGTPAVVPIRVVEEHTPPFAIDIVIKETITLRVQSDQDPLAVKHWVEAFL